DYVECPSNPSIHPSISVESFTNNRRFFFYGFSTSHRCSLHTSRYLVPNLSPLKAWDLSKPRVKEMGRGLCYWCDEKSGICFHAIEPQKTRIPLSHKVYV
ncbi:hypothetical protein S245_012963, partial [Arachis hypogaea]